MPPGGRAVGRVLRGPRVGRCCSLGMSRHFEFLRCSRNWLAAGFTCHVLCGPQGPAHSQRARRSRKVSSDAKPRRGSWAEDTQGDIFSVRIHFPSWKVPLGLGPVSAFLQRTRSLLRRTDCVCVPGVDRRSPLGCGSSALNPQSLCLSTVCFEHRLLPFLLCSPKRLDPGSSAGLCSWRAFPSLGHSCQLSGFPTLKAPGTFCLSTQIGSCPPWCPKWKDRPRRWRRGWPLARPHRSG